MNGRLSKEPLASEASVATSQTRLIVSFDGTFPPSEWGVQRLQRLPSRVSSRLVVRFWIGAVSKSVNSGVPNTRQWVERQPVSKTAYTTRVSQRVMVPSRQPPCAKLTIVPASRPPVVEPSGERPKKTTSRPTVSQLSAYMDKAKKATLSDARVPLSAQPVYEAEQPTDNEAVGKAVTVSETEFAVGVVPVGVGRC